MNPPPNPQPLNPPPLNYQTPVTPHPVYSIPALVVMLICGIVITATAITAQRFEPIFRDFHTDLPLVTQVFLTFSRFYLRGFGWLISVAAVIFFPLVWAAICPPPADPDTARRRRRWLRLAVAVFIFIVVLLAVIALFAPMISLIQTVSSPAKK